MSQLALLICNPHWEKRKERWKEGSKEGGKEGKINIRKQCSTHTLCSPKPNFLPPIFVSIQGNNLHKEDDLKEMFAFISDSLSNLVYSTQNTALEWEHLLLFLGFWTCYHKLNSLKNRNLLSHSSASQKSEIKILEELFPSGDSERICSMPLP